MTDDLQTYDYVIVGGGSAGCVLANRLTASGRHRVLLIEAGPDDASPWIHIPLGYGRLFTDARHNWLYHHEPEPATGNRAIPEPRGKVLGGSSSINGLIYIRGQREDFDHWRQLGNSGWGFDDVLPYFKRAEGNVRGGDDLHGADGPLKVSDGPGPHPLCEALIAAAERCGHRRREDFNGAEQDGFGYPQLTAHRGRRSSAATAYLPPKVRRRRNLEIATGACATRITLEGRRATGVVYRHDGATLAAAAAREVILSAGAIASPQLMQLSGLGPAEHLRRHGIAVHADMAGVGANLQDHYNARLVYQVTRPWTLNDVVRNPVRGAVAAIDYALRGKGMIGMGAAYVAGFLKSGPDVSTPDIQTSLALYSTEKVGEPLHRFSGVSLVVRILRPQSRGTVLVTSPDPAAAPAIKANFLSAPRDAEALISGLKQVRAIVGTQPMAQYVAAEIYPGRGCTSDADWDAYIRAKGGTSFHPVGTCRMGDDAGAVVDARLAVRGIAGLRIADASVMPAIVSGNTNAPAIMIGEKASDMILEDAARA